jgi:hypothetical protein
VPWLATEKANLEAKLQTMVPELLEANGVCPTGNATERSKVTV